jgi:hypothetical protein
MAVPSGVSGAHAGIHGTEKSTVTVSFPPASGDRLQLMVYATILNINGGIALFPLPGAGVRLGRWVIACG